MKVLAKLGCVELVRTRPRRGAVEHFYRATVRPFFSNRDWARLPASARQSISDGLLKLIWSDVSESLRRGKFDARHDRHLSRSPLVVDEQGWKELNEILDELLERAMQIESESLQRSVDAKQETFNTRMMLMHFESGGASPSRGRKRRSK